MRVALPPAAVVGLKQQVDGVAQLDRRHALSVRPFRGALRQAKQPLGIEAIAAAVVQRQPAVGDPPQRHRRRIGHRRQRLQPRGGRLQGSEEVQLVGRVLLRLRLRLGRPRHPHLDPRATDLDQPLRVEPHIQHPAERRDRRLVLGLGHATADDQVAAGSRHGDVLAAAPLLQLGLLLELTELLQAQRRAGDAGVRAGAKRDPPLAIDQHVGSAAAAGPAARVRDHHHRELQPLGGMDRHQQHGIAALVGDRRLTLPCGQVGLLLEEPDEALQVGPAQLLVLASEPDQLAHVGQPPVAVLSRQQGQVEVVLDHDRLAQPLQAEAGQPLHQPVVAQLEGLPEPVVALGQRLRPAGRLEGADRRRPPRGQPDQRQAVVGYAHQRRGQHAQQRPVVGAVDQQPQVGDHVPHLLLSVVAATGRAHGRQAAVAQRILVRAGVGAGLEQQHHVTRRATAGRDQLGDAVCDRLGLGDPPRDVVLAAGSDVRQQQLNRIGGRVALELTGLDQVGVAVAELAAEGLVDQIQHVAARAIVVIERDHLAGCLHASLAVHLDVGATETVDALELVADQEQVTAAHQLHQLDLERLVSWNSSTITSAKRSR